MDKKIYSLIPLIMKDIGFVGKDKSFVINDKKAYDFRGIEDVYNKIQPVLIKHGVFCAPQVIESNSETILGTDKFGKPRTTFRVRLTINHKFYATDGSFVEVTTSGEGVDTGDKATYKAMSGAMKYAVIELFFIPTVNVDDPDKGNQHDGEDGTGNYTDKDIDDLVVKFRKLAVGTNLILKKYNLSSVYDLTDPQIKELYDIGKAIQNKKQPMADFFKVGT